MSLHSAAAAAKAAFEAALKVLELGPKVIGGINQARINNKLLPLQLTDLLQNLQQIKGKIDRVLSLRLRSTAAEEAAERLQQTTDEGITYLQKKQKEQLPGCLPAAWRTVWRCCAGPLEVSTFMEHYEGKLQQALNNVAACLRGVGSEGSQLCSTSRLPHPCVVNEGAYAELEGMLKRAAATATAPASPSAAAAAAAAGAAAAEAHAAETPVLQLLGAAGMGKSTLALRLALDLDRQWATPGWCHHMVFDCPLPTTLFCDFGPWFHNKLHVLSMTPPCSSTWLPFSSAMQLHFFACLGMPWVMTTVSQQRHQDSRCNLQAAPRLAPSSHCHCINVDHLAGSSFSGGCFFITVPPQQGGAAASAADRANQVHQELLGLMGFHDRGNPAMARQVKQELQRLFSVELEDRCHLLVLDGVDSAELLEQLLLPGMRGVVLVTACNSVYITREQLTLSADGDAQLAVEQRAAAANLIRAIVGRDGADEVCVVKRCQSSAFRLSHAWQTPETRAWLVPGR